MAIGHTNIPEYITVHMGCPDQFAANVKVPFPEYIKNAASCIIYPTWPENASQAIIYAIISYALNRIYTQWYRNQGYAFDITNSKEFDQSYVWGRVTFGNINRIVDRSFSDYVRMQNTKEPLFTQISHNDDDSGLSPWGTVTLAEQGLKPVDILKHYYGDDIEIARNTPISSTAPAYPATTLQLSAIGKSVRYLQMQLNRIGNNYPSIPKIDPIDGHFRRRTHDAVAEFQRIFNLTPDGVVGKATWYKINHIFDAVKKLGQLSAEGVQYNEITFVFPTEIQNGDRSDEAKYIQYYLNVISGFIPGIPSVTADGIFGQNTKDSVIIFQRMYNIPDSGSVDNQTLLKIVDVYQGIINTIDDIYSPPDQANFFPGQFLDKSVKGRNVTDLQMYLQEVCQTYTDIPAVEVTGIYDHHTYRAVLAFQRLFGILQTGDVGPNTWNALANEYNELTLAGL